MALELDPETIKYLERLVKRGGHEGEKARSVLEIVKYSEDQERGENGRWVAGDGSKADKESAKAEVSKQTAAAMRADAAGKHSIAAKAHEAAARAAGHLAQHSSGSKGQQKWNSIANAHLGAAESHRALRSATRENTFGNVDSLKEKASSASTYAYILTNQAG